MESVQPETPQIASILFQELPTEVQQMIFSYLSHKDICGTVSLVCKSWCYLSRHCSLWKVVKFKVTSMETWEKFQIFLDGCTCLTSLSLENIMNYMDPIEDLIWSRIPKLRMLKKLELNEVAMENLQSIVTNFPLIKDLTLQSSSCTCPHDIGELAKLKRMESLRLGFYGEFPLLNNCNCIDVIFQECTELKEIMLPRNLVSNERLKKICEYRCCTIQLLHVNGYGLTDDGLQCLASCRKLEFLHIYDFVGRTLTCISKLPLKELYLTNVLHVPPDQFKEMFANSNMSNLEILILSWVSINDEGLQKLSDTCPKLRTIHLDQCDNVKNGMTYVVQKCKRLQRIILGCSYPRGRFPTPNTRLTRTN